MLTVLTQLLHIFEKCAKCFWVFCRLFFCNQDLRSWIVAILQDSMPSVFLHPLHTFKFSTFFSAHGDCHEHAVAMDVDKTPG